MVDYDQEPPKIFNTRDEAYEWFDENHPGRSVFVANNDDGTVSAFLEPPEECCDDCKEDPCLMETHQEQFQGLLEFYRADELLTSNRQRRFKMYREMTRLIHGYLGKNNRKELPKCIADCIRDAFPNEPNVAYIGFRDTTNESPSTT